MKPTSAGIITIITGSLAYLSGYIFGIKELFLFTAMSLIALIIAFSYSLFIKPNLETRRNTKPKKLRTGEKAQLILSIRNNGSRSTPILFAVDKISGRESAKLTFGSIPKSKSINIGYSIPQLKRGILPVGPLKVELQDPLGLTKKNLLLDANSSFLVRPHLYKISPISAATGELKTTTKKSTSKNSGDDEFYTLRPYVMGDDLRKVHWRAAAKSDDLLIIQDRKTQIGAITVVLDSQEKNHTPDSFERAMSATNSILHSAQAGGDLIKFYSSKHPNGIEVKSEEQLNTIEEELSLANPDKNIHVESILEYLSRRSVGGTLITILGSPTNEISNAVSLCRIRHRQIINISCNPDNYSKWTISYDGSKPFPIIWNEALVVTAK